LTGTPATGFILLCLWGIATAAIHIFRAVQIRYTFQNKIAWTASWKELGSAMVDL